MRQFVSAIGGIIVLVLLAMMHDSHDPILIEVTIYAIIMETCILLIATPYDILNHLLSVPSRWIIVTVVVVNTVTFRLRLSIEFVAIPACISIFAILAVVRKDKDWRAFRAYQDDETIHQAMSMNEESSAWKSWKFHGYYLCEEMAYRRAAYTNSDPFNNKDIHVLDEVQHNIMNHRPVKLRDSIAKERMMDFMGMCYRLGYLRSVSYKQELNEMEATVDEKEKVIEQLQEYIERLKQEVSYYKAEAERLNSYDADEENRFQKTIDEYSQYATWADKRIKELKEYSDELEQTIDMRERELQNLKQELETLEEVNEHKCAVDSGKIVEMDEIKTKLKRASPDDVKEMERLRSKGLTIAAIAEELGLSESTIKRKLSKKKQA